MRWSSSWWGWRQETKTWLKLCFAQMLPPRIAQRKSSKCLATPQMIMNRQTKRKSQLGVQCLSHHFTKETSREYGGERPQADPFWPLEGRRHWANPLSFVIVRVQRRPSGEWRVDHRSSPTTERRRNERTASHQKSTGYQSWIPNETKR